MNYIIANPLVPPCFLLLVVLVLHINTKESLSEGIRKKFIQNKRYETNSFGQPKNIVLWAHGRSGSKFVSNILSSVKSTFLMQEPIHSGVGITHFHPELVPKALTLLKKCLACNFSNETRMMTSQIENHGHFEVDPTLKYLCSRNYGLRNTCASNPKISELACHVAKHRVFRVISLNFNESKLILERTSNVRIVHLIRDPRATILSYLKISTVLNQTANVIKYCSLINKEITYVGSISSDHPGRYFMVRYEDVAASPLATTRKLFSKLGLPYTISVATFVRRITTTKSDQKGYHDDLFGINRVSEKTLVAWRRDIPYNLYMAIQNECKPFLEFGKYVSFKSEKELRNVNLSSVKRAFASSETPYII